MSGSNLAVVEHPLDGANLPATSTPVDNAPPIAQHYDDPDDQERRDALAAVEAERNASGSATPQQTPAAPAPAAAPPAANDEVMIPKARFDELARRVQAAETALAYREGQIAQMQQGAAAQPSTTTEPATQAKSPDELDAEQAIAIEAEWNKAWSDYETGAISGTEKGAIEVQLLSRVISMNMGRVLRDLQNWTVRYVQSQAPAVGVVDQEVMRAHVERLEAEHPWSRDLNENEARALLSMAHAEAQALGRSYPKGPTGTMALQRRVAELASIHMPQWRHGQEPPASAQPAAQPPSAPAPARPATAPTRADITEAMRRRDALPPNSPGSHGENSGPVTLDRINTMTDEEIDRLPAVERHRLLGIQS